MTGSKGRGRGVAIVALATAAALNGGVAQAQGARDISAGVQQELAEAEVIRARYDDRASKNRGSSIASGAFVLVSAFYGAAVTAFNPAPKNLKAAILAQGVSQAWNVNLKPAERARIYRKGERAMGCVIDAGEPLRSYETEAGQLRTLRDGAAKALAMADRALSENPEMPPESALMAFQGDLEDVSRADLVVGMLRAQQMARARDDKRETLQALMKTLGELDAKLAAEQAAYQNAPFLVAKARRGVEATVDDLLAGAAPDYKGAAEVITGSVADLAAPAEAEPAAPDAQGLVPSAEEVSVTLDDAIEAVTASIRRIQAGAPDQAVKAFKHMEGCGPTAD